MRELRFTGKLISHSWSVAESGFRSRPAISRVRASIHYTKLGRRLRKEPEKSHTIQGYGLLMLPLDLSQRCTGLVLDSVTSET